MSGLRTDEKLISRDVQTLACNPPWRCRYYESQALRIADNIDGTT